MGPVPPSNSKKCCPRPRISPGWKVKSKVLRRKPLQFRPAIVTTRARITRLTLRRGAAVRRRWWISLLPLGSHGSARDAVYAVRLLHHCHWLAVRPGDSSLYPRPRLDKKLRFLFSLLASLPRRGWVTSRWSCDPLILWRPMLPSLLMLSCLPWAVAQAKANCESRSLVSQSDKAIAAAVATAAAASAFLSRSLRGASTRWIPFLPAQYSVCTKMSASRELFLRLSAN